ncbi:MAG: bifunctional lysine ketoglutarate reductase /saccharopine dehydrogenase family protein [Candidatus Hodarchaeales archaeon]|jgi:alpha-aminoadipic semialdehyde synthase
MNNTIGIRLEDKNIWETRAPIIPKHMKTLISKEFLKFIVQSSKIRTFSDDDYREAGAVIASDLKDADVIFAIKEIPIPVLEQEKTYIFFSHTIKGQKYNMPMLKKILELKCTLIDYEKVLNEKGFRLIFFGNYAGMAGMIETLWGYGKRVKGLKNINNPFLQIKHAYQYDSLEIAQEAIGEIGKKITKEGLPKELVPLVVGFAGYGNVSSGAQSVLEALPVMEIDPTELINFYEKKEFSQNHVYKVVFKEEHMVEPIEGRFELQDYYNHGKTKYRGVFENYIPFLSILINGIYWSEKYPRLLSKDYVKRMFESKEEIRLLTIGDISCDIEGGIEPTITTTEPDNPIFIYNPITNKATISFEDAGIAIQAVDNLPCELPRESSTNFSKTLVPFVPMIAQANYTNSFSELDLPPVIKNAVIVHQGELTPNYKYIAKFESFKKAGEEKVF